MDEVKLFEKLDKIIELLENIETSNIGINKSDTLNMLKFLKIIELLENIETSNTSIKQSSFHLDIIWKRLTEIRAEMRGVDNLRID